MKRKVLTVLALGLLVVENGFDFVGSVPYFRRITGGLGILDMLPFPDAERAHRALAALGADGRQQYALLLVTFDAVFPLTLALFFNAYIVGRLRVLPWLTLALDYAENVACLVLVATFPHEAAWIASLAGVLTAFKFAGYLACVLAMAYASWHALAERRRRGGVTPGTRGAPS